MKSRDTWSHLDGARGVDRRADAGRADFGGRWIDRISTGNDDLVHYDVDGGPVEIERRHDTAFPDQPPRAKSVQVL
ncbi:beta/gamma crystallin domain-containing protein [Kitasatospora phosalacinea]|uniref:beta/gamma crystallin domain-containing protein n=1 Tax=Kitasatospora phosalacinea TaxID=2065 RepID=UPI00068C6468|nr:beta/gamma crystallin domain-containing protein [Kitasatospora phosalacinea]